jgi:hypothetical protein
LAGRQPVIVLLSLERDLQHCVWLVRIDESRQCVVVLNMDGVLLEANLDDLKVPMDAGRTWDHWARQFDVSSVVRFDFAVDKPKGSHCLVM